MLPRNFVMDPIFGFFSLFDDSIHVKSRTHPPTLRHDNRHRHDHRRPHPRRRSSQSAAHPHLSLSLSIECSQFILLLIIIVIINGNKRVNDGVVIRSLWFQYYKQVWKERVRHRKVWDPEEPLFEILHLTWRIITLVFTLCLPRV